MSEWVGPTKRRKILRILHGKHHSTNIHWFRTKTKERKKKLWKCLVCNRENEPGPTESTLHRHIHTHIRLVERMCVIHGSTLLFVLNKLFGRTGGGILVIRLLHSHAATAAAASTWNRLRFTSLPSCLRQITYNQRHTEQYTDPENMCAFYCAYQSMYGATFFSPSNFAFFIRFCSTVCVCVCLSVHSLVDTFRVPVHREEWTYKRWHTHTYVRTCDARKHFPSECVQYW